MGHARGSLWPCARGQQLFNYVVPGARDRIHEKDSPITCLVLLAPSILFALSLRAIRVLCKPPVLGRIAFFVVQHHGFLCF